MKPVSRVLVIAMVLMSLINANGQHVRHDIKAILDSVIFKAKNTALYSHEVKWDSVIAEMYKQARHAKTVKDLKAGFETLLNSLKDHNGKFINPGDQSSLATFTAWSPQPGKLNHQATAPLPSASQAKFNYKILDDSIGYLRIIVPGSDVDVQKEAAIIRSALDSLHKDNVRKWIIDLRYANGSNSAPILAGIAPLIGEGQIGGLVDGKNRIKKLFEIHNGNFYDDQRLVAKFPCVTKTNDAKIAVLISRNTVAAGEAVAVAFKERKNTRFFGEPTHGNTVVTSTIAINHNLVMSLSESLYIDRLGHVHSGNIHPDVVVDFAPTENPMLDNAIMQATEWLTGNDNP